MAEYEFDTAHGQIKHDDIVGLRRALEAGLNINLQNRHGDDLLIAAAHKGNVAIGELLIRKGANVNHVSQSGWTAGSAALADGHVRFLKLLFEHGADPNSTWGGKSIEEWASDKNAEAVCALLEKYRTNRPSS